MPQVPTTPTAFHMPSSFLGTRVQASHCCNIPASCSITMCMRVHRVTLIRHPRTYVRMFWALSTHLHPCTDTYLLRLCLCLQLLYQSCWPPCSLECFDARGKNTPIGMPRDPVASLFVHLEARVDNGFHVVCPPPQPKCIASELPERCPRGSTLGGKHTPSNN